MQVLQGISQNMNKVAANGAAEDFSRMGLQLAQLQSLVREEIQAATAERVSGIIQKLESQEPLNPEEKDMVGLWIVGDAEGYIKMEDDFREWQEEFRRLGRVLETYEGRGSSPQTLVELHGVLEDAVRVISDISCFLEKKERLERFQTAINNVNPEDGKFLASMLKAKLASANI